MEIQVSFTGGLTIIALHGRFLGNKDSDDFTDSVKECLRKESGTILVDLADIDYINSMGLGALFAGYVMVKKAGGRYVLANAGERVMEMLQLTGTDTTIPIYANVNDAKKSLS